MKRLIFVVAILVVAVGGGFVMGQCPSTPPDSNGNIAPIPPSVLSSLDSEIIITAAGSSDSVQSEFAVDSFFDITYSVGGGLGGEIEDFNAALLLEMQGMGGPFAGFNRHIAIPVHITAQAGPRTPGDPVQEFATEIVLLTGEVLGDPDFDLLQVKAGSGFGLPSPGHTTLTQLPSGDFAVDSFFDITYEINFTGNPTSIFAGMAGTTTGRIRLTTCPGGGGTVNSIKWVQPPDLTRNGIDIRIDRNDNTKRTLADDFLCTQTGAITKISFWGSWLGDPQTHAVSMIHLSIHKDIPAVPGVSYSTPGTLLWDANFLPATFTETLAADISPDWEWWMDIYNAAMPPNPNGDHKIYRYDILIDPNIAFIQEGTATDPIVYWLDIYANTNSDFGWKTSSEHWNDDAVYWNIGSSPGWVDLKYPQGHPYNPNSIDLSFVIGTEPVVDPTEACCFDNGTCLNLTPAECMKKHGTPQGAGTICLGDINQNGVDDACDDCNGNGISDVDDIASGFSQDCNGNGIPDECEKDCNGNGIPDDCDINSGFSLDNNGNGIPDECEGCQLNPVDCPSGQPALLMVAWAGIADSFILPIELASPDAALLNYINTCSAPGVALEFDQIPGENGVPANSWLGHTFTGLPGAIIAAKLEIRVRATAGYGSGGTYNDHISIVDTITGCTPTWAWSSRFENLPEAGGTWSPGQTATFCLDLSALPTTAGTVDILSQLANGTLSIRVDDDSGVDYIRLHLAVCPCEYQYLHEFVAGTDDLCKFTLPTEPASPSTELVTAFGSNWRDFDKIVSNRRFGHTFTGLPPNIAAAELELCIRAGHDIPTNDVLALEFLNPTFAWSKGLASLTGMAWNVGDQKKLVLDLDNLLPSTFSITSVLANLGDGDLDVYIQDDTAIDYLILRVWTCCDKSIPGDNNFDGKVNLVDLAIQANNWLVGVGP